MRPVTSTIPPGYHCAGDDASDDVVNCRQLAQRPARLVLRNVAVNGTVTGIWRRASYDVPTTRRHINVAPVRADCDICTRQATTVTTADVVRCMTYDGRGEERITGPTSLAQPLPAAPLRVSLILSARCREREG